MKDYKHQLTVKYGVVSAMTASPTVAFSGHKTNDLSHYSVIYSHVR